MAKVSAKEVLQTDNWIITKIIGGYKGKIRIDAKTRNWIADGQNFFSDWVTLKYANRCRREVDRNELEVNF